MQFEQFGGTNLNNQAIKAICSHYVGRIGVNKAQAKRAPQRFPNSQTTISGN
jgi:hypothetical protein